MSLVRGYREILKTVKEACQEKLLKIHTITRQDLSRKRIYQERGFVTRFKKMI